MITELNLPFSTVKEANITSEELIKILSSPKEYEVTFNCTPNNLTLVVKDSKGEIMQPKSDNAYLYILPVGTYTYTASKEGYKLIENEQIEVVDTMIIEVELIIDKQYITLDGLHYIDTEIKPNQDTKVEIKLELTQSLSGNIFIFGSRTATNSKNSFACAISNTQIMPRVGTSKPNFSHTFSVGKSTIIKLSTTACNIDEDFDNTVSAIVTGDTLNMYLGSLNQNNVKYNSFLGKIYYFKIWQGEELIRDFIPYVQNDVECMKDNVSGQIFILKS